MDGGGKVCVDCGEDKDIGEYYRDSHNRSGYRAECKPCTIKRRIELAGDKEAYKAIQADYMRHWRDSKRKGSKHE